MIYPNSSVSIKQAPKDYVSCYHIIFFGVRPLFLYIIYIYSVSCVQMASNFKGKQILGEGLKLYFYKLHLVDIFVIFKLNNPRLSPFNMELGKC